MRLRIAVLTGLILMAGCVPTNDAPEPSSLILSVGPAIEDFPPKGIDSITGVTLPTGEKVFFGQPLSIRAANADVVDVVRTLTALEHISATISPAVSGRVNMRIDGGAADQALDLAVTEHGIELKREGNGYLFDSPRPPQGSGNGPASQLFVLVKPQDVSLEDKTQLLLRRKPYSAAYLVTVKATDVSTPKLLAALFETAGVNYSISPNVNGSTTIAMDSVPWHDAVANIMKTAQLDAHDYDTGPILLVDTQTAVEDRVRKIHDDNCFESFRHFPSCPFAKTDGE